jgi:hypothetical protein
VRTLSPLAAICLVAAGMVTATVALVSPSPGAHRAPVVSSAPLGRRAPGLPGVGSGGGGLGQALPKPLKEIVADRTATTSTWRNANGTLTVRQYLTAHFYKSASGKWLPIDPVLAATAGKPGWWHANASSFPALFGPAGAAGGAEQVIAGGSQIGFAPLGVSDPSLAPSVTGSTATYTGMWPDTTMTEQVTASQVSEEIVLTGPGAPPVFSFGLAGATARPDAAGGLEVLAGGRQVGVIPAPTVTGRLATQFRQSLSGGPETADLTAVSGRG